MFKKSLVYFSFALVFLGGCGPFWVNPYITVEDSQLNWMHIHYYNLSKSPLRRTSVYLSGTGMVEVRKGTSEQVSNDFAKGYKRDNWDDISVTKKHVDTEHLNNIFQNLVNHGVLDREKLFRKVKGKKTLSRFMGVKANINNVTYSENENIFEVDPDLAEVLLDVVRQFDNPVSR
jgi:hypothetical protein